MSAGLVLPAEEVPAQGVPAHELPAREASGGIVSALRPNAMVLVVLRNATDLPEVLSALRV
jgi:hypothetical protein